MTAGMASITYLLHQADLDHRLALIAANEGSLVTDEPGIPVTVCHYPPGTSKWNKIEHRMFSFISMNRQGVPLRNYETVINLIGHTTTKAGLRVRARLDRMPHDQGVKITTKPLNELRIMGIGAHPDWNYTVAPSLRTERHHGK